MLERPDYLKKYSFNWDLLDVILSGRSSLDAKSFLVPMDEKKQVQDFLVGYGFDPRDPVLSAELFGNFQEAIQFIKRYFLKEGSESGLNLEIPSSFYTVTKLEELFLISNKRTEGGSNKREALWAEIILKVMHTIIHADRDLRQNYLSVIQQQIFDRYYKYLSRDGDNNLYLGNSQNKFFIRLKDFQTKSRKKRESVIIKMLHKAENVAEELFDRIGIRFITFTKLDALRVVKFLQEQHIVMAHNVKPSRSFNSLIDLQEFRRRRGNVIRMAIRNQLTEERFTQALEREIKEHAEAAEIKRKAAQNTYSSKGYKSIQFTCRQLINFKNPLLSEMVSLRKMAQNDDGPLAKKILSLDLSAISQDSRFFYPYEVQIVDQEAYQVNTEGEASHQKYKESQKKSAMLRLFRELLIHQNIDPELI